MYPSVPELGGLGSRREVFRFFDGYSADRKQDLNAKRTKTPLVKSYLFELLGSAVVPNLECLETAFLPARHKVRQIDDDLFRLLDPQDQTLGFIEPLTVRIIALYSTIESKSLDPAARRLVQSSPLLDHVWLSGLTFAVLWDLVAKLSDPHRFVTLTFTHQSIFDIDTNVVEQEAASPTGEGDTDNNDADEDLGEEEDAYPIVERRAARFRLVDRIATVKAKLQTLQEAYDPLHAISQLRFPSPVGRGGHDFYENGKATNRSESFRDHRAHLLFVTQIYQGLLGRTEAKAWGRSVVGTHGPFGVPLIVRFREPLSSTVFDQWVSSTFGRSRNKFRLWGSPIRLGPTKVHVYGLDRHLWQPLYLELTASGCTAVLPAGTCGNTVHRLVTNIQRYLDPGATAFLGDTPYSQVVREASSGVEMRRVESD